MFQDYNWRNPRPKSTSAIDEAVFNGANAPIELLEFRYREKFCLSAEQMEAEPTDKFFTNLYIYAQIRRKEELENKHGS